MKMFNRLLIAVALTGASSFAFAQHGNGRGDDDHGHGHDNRGHDDRRYYDRDHHDNGHHYGNRGYGGPRRWARGGRYDGPVYVVRDYGHYRLRQPPRGYHWVRGDDSNFLLVAIATGVILDIATH